MFPEMLTAINYIVGQATTDYNHHQPLIKDKNYTVDISGCALNFNVLIPCIDIKLTAEHRISIEDMVRLSSDLIESLTSAALQDYCDLYFTIDFDEPNQRIQIEFIDYNIRS